ncbi:MULTISPECIES: Rieske (2Fe-2S) protein [Micromonospora]|uniref:Cytochrome bc1 complex Rieske iron-sulfur subunit n=1 Tax=Micromonospora yangpuensis TaxID=683228 RepID=A0A1C6UYN1_9ACTN|nr:Rieske (2Fe-2S) protein [Micromonospora yangpuensis]GGL95528.1 iron-sulfur protein [Micromonospora yangpuensis]SCL59173.1 Ferredoxin subunit of nitrite reductase or a ring-hydroxylating dioxygenase [Micromonospora yangpuensis]
MSDDQVFDAPVTQTRRTLLAGAGALGAAVVLTACGSDRPTATTDNEPDGDGSTGGDGSPGDGAAVLAKTADIPVGGGKVFAPQGVVVTQPTAGEFKAFDPICTHQNCPVSNVDGGTINCTCHGSKFSITDGSVQGGPATRPLAAKEVTVSGEDITLA